MIVAKADDTIKSIEKAQETITNKLESMVRSFAINFSESAIDNTPIGDAKNDVKKLYTKRAKKYGVLPEEGLAKGNWQISLNSNNAEFKANYGKSSDARSLQSIVSEIMHYKLGDNISLINPLGYVKLIEQSGANGDPHSKQAPQGIATPTMTEITNLYKGTALLKEYYDES